MRFGETPVAQALGHVLAHGIRLPGGAMKKGRVLDAADLERLSAAGHETVVTASLEADDVAEDEAAEMLARALAGGPDLILADEPTASLDAQSGLQAMQLLRRLASEHGTTVIVVTHDSRIFHFADRILHMDEGRVANIDEGVLS